ncbi:MAG: hypothetical protein KDA85_09320 [Planctomycetaceae bacterium]|nr:hypothetical protein [Planctomycetaceae bacterium]
MRTVFLIIWLALLPVGLMYHLVERDSHQRMDQVGDYLAEARRLRGSEEWGPAVAAYEKALELLPAEPLGNRQELRLEMAQAKMNASRLPEAHEELKGLLDELLEQETRDQNLENRIRESMAHSQFFMTWLMRLEGLPRESWEPEIESARQNFHLLAQRAEQTGSTEAALTQKQNLQKAIQLARLDPGELLGLPIPSQ